MAEIFEDRDYELSGISKFNRYIGDLASTQFCKFVTFKVYGYMLARYAMLNNMDRPCFTWDLSVDICVPENTGRIVGAYYFDLRLACRKGEGDCKCSWTNLLRGTDVDSPISQHIQDQQLLSAAKSIE